MNKYKLQSFLLRIGLASVFLFAGIDTLTNPNNWLGFIPVWFRSLSLTLPFIYLFSIFQIILSIWLISNKKPYSAATASTITISAIIIFNIHLLNLIFRDIAILFMSIALMILLKENKKRKKK
ncbi:MAG: DoxX family membrane protein [Nanoarchaeota archaeon]|nr:DoxX family membrane protein [Nanoarchaeota archaeon]